MQTAHVCLRCRRGCNSIAAIRSSSKQDDAVSGRGVMHSLPEHFIKYLSRTNITIAIQSSKQTTHIFRSGSFFLDIFLQVFNLRF